MGKQNFYHYHVSLADAGTQINDVDEEKLQRVVVNYGELAKLMAIVEDTTHNHGPKRLNAWFAAFVGVSISCLLIAGAIYGLAWLMVAFRTLMGW